MKGQVLHYLLDDRPSKVIRKVHDRQWGCGSLFLRVYFVNQEVEKSGGDLADGLLGRGFTHDSRWVVVECQLPTLADELWQRLGRVQQLRVGVTVYATDENRTAVRDQLGGTKAK